MGKRALTLGEFMWVVPIAAALVLAGGVGANSLDRILQHTPAVGDQQRLKIAVGVIIVGCLFGWFLKRRQQASEQSPVSFEQFAGEIVAVTGRESFQQLSSMIPEGLKTVEVLLEPGLEYVRPYDNSDPVVPGGPVERTVAFNESNGKLLIVGEPGSGKTVVLYRMIQDYQSTAGALPSVLVNLSAWNPEVGSFDDFLVSMLCDPRGFFKRTENDAVRDAVRGRRLGLFLDGLDEVHPAFRRSLLEAFETYTRVPSAGPVVVTCRETEFQGLGLKLGLNMAVRVPDLDEANVREVADRLQSMNAGWARLAQPDGHVPRWLCRPLFLSMAVRSGCDPISVGADTTDARVPGPELFERFIENRLKGATEFPQAKVWLAFVAEFLIGEPVG
jgi:NACHT domain